MKQAKAGVAVEYVGSNDPGQLTSKRQTCQLVPNGSFSSFLTGSPGLVTLSRKSNLIRLTQ